VVRGNLLRARAARLEAAALALRTLDPRQVVGRGYALVRDEQDRLVTDAGQLRQGQPLQVELASGFARVRVESTGP
jgi:exodeoxyribonuclease VII large subunit